MFPTAAFEVQDEADLAALTELQRAQLRSALNYHALVNPGAEIEARVTVGDITQLPILTGPLAERPAEAEPLLTLRIRSTAVGNGADRTGTPVTRCMRVGHAEADLATTEPEIPESLPRRLYRVLEHRSPVALDVARETVTRRREQRIAAPLPRYPEGAGDTEIARAFAGQPTVPLPAAAPRAVLFGLHWLQAAGAERWAIESISIAKAEGLLPIVVTDQDSLHPWLTRPELEGCIVIALNSDGQGAGSAGLDPALLSALLENYDLRGVVIHHCTWLYRSLPWLTQQRPGLPVVDSLHIVEALGGGFPGLAVRFDEFITTHHVISPELDRWLTETQGVNPAKITMAPLTALTVDETQQFTARDPRRPFTLAYIGRLSRQKRPDVFLMLMQHMRRRGLPVRAIMHGDGELRELVDALSDRFRLRSVIEQRFEDDPVSETLAESDLLVIPSMNEGLTLTTFEALAAGVPVLSADVGSQRTIVQEDMLLPRAARRFVREAERAIAALVVSERYREEAWNAQQERVTAFMRHPDAHHFMKELFAQWQA